ncbi:hypothetical protein [Actinomadura sp. DC4]|uniref:hypothetical protein n=1 Tax=Actinomadura sp. DC4 TaxID=3055069 RepID=UPI0025B02060|nr:hypothetical protein [Actinomadura sp. DC4]MDN3356401.1 hypothetical protein [Actinomadura sp. DC4]
MYKRTYGTLACAAAVALVFAGTAHAAPSPIRATFGLNSDGKGNIGVVAAGELDAGDCRLIRQEPIILNIRKGTMRWVGLVLTTASPDPDVWHATFQFRKRNGDNIGRALHFDGPQMRQINRPYPFDLTVPAFTTTGVFPAFTVVETSSC